MSGHGAIDPPPTAEKELELARGAPAPRLGARLYSWADSALPLLGLALALGLGLAIRLYYVIRSDFPLNDGGLFYTMAQDLQRSHYLLPQYTTYNAASIPFAYPPLAFYVAALLDDLGPWSLLDVVRFLPLAANVLAILAFFLLCRALLRSRLMTALAVVIFAVLPRSFKWLIMGGGLTRSLGFLFALLAIHQVYLLYTRRQKRFVLTSIILAGLTVLTHPEIAWFTAFSCALLFIGYGRNRQGVINSALVVGGVVAMTIPWLTAVAARQEISSLLVGAQTGEHSWSSWRSFIDWGFTEQPYLNWSALLGLVGAFIAFAGGHLFLPVWLGAIVLLEPRSAGTYATVPLAMLIAICLTKMVLPMWRKPASAHPAAALAQAQDGGSARGRLVHVQGLLPKAAVALFMVYISTLAVKGALNAEPSLLLGLPKETRDTMAWVATNTPKDSKFLVVTGGDWWGDRTSEWFPALAKRPSLATPQGYEWFGKEAFAVREAEYWELQGCWWQDVDCLEDWAEEADVDFTHVYVVQGCCESLETALRESFDYSVIYDPQPAAIFLRHPPWLLPKRSPPTP